MTGKTLLRMASQGIAYLEERGFHAPGGHDDAANSACGALTLAAAGGEGIVEGGLKMLRWDDATDDHVRPFPRATLT
jgi:hypothetical protein